MLHRSSILRTFPWEKSYLGECSENELVEVVYRPRGKGQERRTAWAAERLLDGLPAWLERVCGSPLADFSVAQLPKSEPDLETGPPPLKPQPNMVLGKKPVAPSTEAIAAFTRSSASISRSTDANATLRS